MVEFLDIYDLKILNQNEINNLNKLLSPGEIEAVIQKTLN